MFNKQAIKAAGDLKKSDVGSQQELEEIRALYQKEALQRRLLYNQVRRLILQFVSLFRF